MELQSFTQEFQSLFGFLHERSIVQEDIIYLTIDNDQHEYWVKLKDAPQRLKTYPIPKAITIESPAPAIAFYPDGSIDKITVRIANDQGQKVSLTTEGVFGGIKQVSP